MARFTKARLLVQTSLMQVLAGLLVAAPGPEILHGYHSHYRSSGNSVRLVNTNVSLWLDSITTFPIAASCSEFISQAFASRFWLFQNKKYSTAGCGAALAPSKLKKLTSISAS